MFVYLRSGEKLKHRLNPDVDEYTRRVELDGPRTLSEIIDGLGIPRVLIAFAIVDGKYTRLDYTPTDGESVTLQSPVAGG